MKTVTIPTCANPFVVIINGKKYTYPAGETVSVPDEVAEVIERHEEAHPKPEEMPSEEKIFDLSAMGLEPITEVGKAYYLNTDVTELRAAMAKGEVTLTARFFTENSSITVTGTAMHLSHTDTYYLSETAYIIEGMWVVISFAVLVDQIWVNSAPLATQTISQ